MKQLLFLFTLFITCSINAVAQPPGSPVTKIIGPFPDKPEDITVTHDANFVFNKHYYEAENQWVTFPKRPNYAFTKGMYSLAFIYFDAQAGYTMINYGLFDMEASGQAFRDTSASTPRAAALNNVPSKVQISPSSFLVAVIPDKMLADMKLKKIPDWLTEYRRNNPDTFKTLTKKLLFGHTFTVQVGDVGKHIGEHVIVEGRLYGGVVKPDPDRPGFNTISLYIGGGNYPNQKFTILIKNTKTGSASFASKFVSTPVGEQYVSAEGTIFLYEGKPAVEIKDENLGFLQFVDSGRPTPAMQ